MITQFNEKGHPMVFGDESVNAGHLKEKCLSAITSLTRQHGLAERLAEACFMLALSELENNWRERAEAAEEQLDELAKQEPYVWFGKVSLNVYGSQDGDDSRIPLFTRPAPAVALAELVPDEVRREDAPCNLDAYEADCWASGANWIRNTILRNIEEAK